MSKILRRANGTGRGPLQFQKEHRLIAHATRASEDGLDGRVQRLDDAEADGMIANSTWNLSKTIAAFGSTSPTAFT